MLGPPHCQEVRRAQQLVVSHVVNLAVGHEPCNLPGSLARGPPTTTTTIISTATILLRRRRLLYYYSYSCSCSYSYSHCYCYCYAATTAATTITTSSTLLILNQIFQRRPRDVGDRPSQRLTFRFKDFTMSMTTLPRSSSSEKVREFAHRI